MGIGAGSVEQFRSGWVGFYLPPGRRVSGARRGGEGGVDCGVGEGGSRSHASLVFDRGTVATGQQQSPRICTVRGGAVPRARRGQAGRRDRDRDPTGATGTAPPPVYPLPTGAVPSPRAITASWTNNHHCTCPDPTRRCSAGAELRLQVLPMREVRFWRPGDQQWPLPLGSDLTWVAVARLGASRLGPRAGGACAPCRRPSCAAAGTSGATSPNGMSGAAVCHCYH